MNVGYVPGLWGGYVPGLWGGYVPGLWGGYVHGAMCMGCGEAGHMHVHK